MENAISEITRDGHLTSMVKERIISPMLQEVCLELYPYIYICAGVMVLVVTLLVVVTVILIGQVFRGP